MMARRKLTPTIVCLAMMVLVVSGAETQAGGCASCGGQGWSLAGNCSSCNRSSGGCSTCSAGGHNHSAAMVPTCAAPMSAPAPSCGCGGISTGCCAGAGGFGVAGMSMMMGQFAGGAMLSGGGPTPQSGFLSGYENHPQMDGGGVHYRYPYHSYRRPWFNPGVSSTNINIAW